LPFSVQFSTHNPPNLIIIESHRNQVVFRAAQDNFSERRKAFLIRQLAAEGYIPDEFEEYTEHTRNSNLIWVIDRSLLYIGPEASRRCSRFMQRLVVGGCVLWLVEIGLLFFKA
jgi:hypothetical protein